MAALKRILFKINEIVKLINVKQMCVQLNLKTLNHIIK